MYSFFSVARFIHHIQKADIVKNYLDDLAKTEAQRASLKSAPEISIELWQELFTSNLLAKAPKLSGRQFRALFLARPIENTQLPTQEQIPKILTKLVLADYNHPILVRENVLLFIKLGFTPTTLFPPYNSGQPFEYVSYAYGYLTEAALNDLASGKLQNEDLFLLEEFIKKEIDPTKSRKLSKEEIMQYSDRLLAYKNKKIGKLVSPENFSNLSTLLRGQMVEPRDTLLALSAEGKKRWIDSFQRGEKFLPFERLEHLELTPTQRRKLDALLDQRATSEPRQQASGIRIAAL